MFLYHGTSIRFDTPSLSFCKPYRDFGRGFYAAENYFDALPMAIKNSDVGYILTFEILDWDSLEILRLQGYSHEWFRFVVGSRLGERSNYDLVVGNMAGGGRNLKSKFSKYRRDSTPPQIVIADMREQLTTTDLGRQYAFLTPLALSKLDIINIETIEREYAV